MDKKDTFKDLKSGLLVMIAFCILVVNQFAIAEEYTLVFYDYINDSNNMDGIMLEEEIEEGSFSSENIVGVVKIINNKLNRDSHLF